jgi:hypothetical protein
MMNDETEQFERRLRRQPLKPVPAGWRAEILAAAKLAARRSEAKTVQPSWRSTINRQLSTIFWPHPKAWAGLAAIWIFIFAMNFSMRDPAPRVVEKTAPPSPEVMVELKKQQLLFAELVGACEPLDADRQKLFSPKPRSECVEILMA